MTRTRQLEQALREAIEVIEAANPLPPYRAKAAEKLRKVLDGNPTTEWSLTPVATRQRKPIRVIPMEETLKKIEAINASLHEAINTSLHEAVITGHIPATCTNCGGRKTVPSAFGEYYPPVLCNHCNGTGTEP